MTFSTRSDLIIDSDCHLAAHPEGIGIGADELVRQMDENGVAQAVIWPMAEYVRDFSADNDAIHAGTARYPGRLIPFGGLNPRLGMDQALESLKRCQAWGFRGVKLNGARDGFMIDDPSWSLPLIEKIHEYGMILALHCGSNDFERTHPYRVAKIARQFPALPILMVHMGGVSRPDLHLHEAAIEFAAQHPNILIADSEAHPRYILKAIQVLGADRVCYASDTPFQYMHVMLAMHRALLRDLSDSARAQVMGQNMARLLAG